MEMLAGYISVENEKCQQQNGAVCVYLVMNDMQYLEVFVLKPRQQAKTPIFFPGKHKSDEKVC